VARNAASGIGSRINCTNTVIQGTISQGRVSGPGLSRAVTHATIETVPRSAIMRIDTRSSAENPSVKSA